MSFPWILEAFKEIYNANEQNIGSLRAMHANISLQNRLAGKLIREGECYSVQSPSAISADQLMHRGEQNQMLVINQRYRRTMRHPDMARIESKALPSKSGILV